jgi:hypothetical protein
MRGEKHMRDKTAMVVATDEPELSPIVLDVGTRKKGVIKALKNGRGRLMDEVEATVEDVRANLGEMAAGKELVPVVLIFRQKSKRRRTRGLLGG